MSVVDVALTPVIKKSGSRCLRSSESMVIYLTVTGSVIPMRIMESDSIGAVKHRIQTCNGFVVKKQKLIFGGRELSRNNSLVRDYGVCSGDVLHLIQRVSDVLVVSVEMSVGFGFGFGFEFEVDRFRNVKYLKQMVLEKAKGMGFMDVEEHKILCNGERLDVDDHMLIDDICNNHDALIHLVVQNVVFNSDERSIETDEKTNLKKPPDIDTPLQPVIVNRNSKLSPGIWSMLDSVFDGLRKGRKPIRSADGTGGTYFMQHPSGNRYAAVFKPIDEEPMAVNNPQGLPVSKNGEGLKRGTKVGEGALREVAAYILDHPKSGPRVSGDMGTGFAGVPPTIMAKCLNGEFNHPKGYYGGPENVKLGSLQMFMKNCGSCEDMGPRDFPVEEVHKITVFDIRTANADRHAGNILMNREGDRVVLIPIDHGYCLPENFEDCTFDWLYWPQAREPYSRETMDYIKTLDAEQDLALLSSNGWDLSRECARTLRVSTMLLKKGATRGLCPYIIGRVLCRETLNKASMIEKIVEKACSISSPGTTEAEFLATISDLLDFELDKISGKSDL